MSFLKWFYPGMYVKRWLGLVLLGIVFISLGFAFILKEIYETVTFPGWVADLTLQFWPRWIRAIIVAMVGTGVIVFAVWRLNHSLLSAFIPEGQEEALVDTIYQHRKLKRGPHIVASGGGTGLSTLLRGLKMYTANITAIVNVVDDGGSSGRLRREMGMLPPGDLRQCIVALADAEPLMKRLFEHRFPSGSGLEGHNFGNLFIAAMRDITGNFERAIRESSRVLAVRGQILPATLADLTISAEYDDETHMEGESIIAKQHKHIKRVYLNPEHPAAYPEALRAILRADMIIIGPGSLYTSILPNLLVTDIALAIRASDAVKVFVTNVSTEPGETDGFKVGDFVKVIRDHVGSNVFDYVLANDKLVTPNSAQSAPVPLNGAILSLEHQHIKVVTADLVDEENPLRHDPQKLINALGRLYNMARQSRGHDTIDLTPGKPGTNGDGDHSIPLSRSNADEASHDKVSLQ